MKIEKTSKYVFSSVPSRSLLDGGHVRKVLLSLPRVRWLERDQPAPEPPEYVEMNNTDSYIALTKTETAFLRMMDEDNMTIKEISRKRKISVVEVHNRVEIARRKMLRKEAAKVENRQ